MAKHNFVILNGYVSKNPKILKDEGTGEYVRGICTITVIRGVRDFGNNIDHIKYDSPIIMSGNPDIIKIMDEWKEGDMVEIKGSITTKDVTKSTKCTHCGHVNKRKGNVVYVNPIYVSTRERNLAQNEAIALLKQRCEVSNQVTVIGPVCREPVLYKTEKGLSITTYQLAVRRKYRIKDDNPDTKTDFPWVKSYGSIANNDAKVIKKGTYIFLDGMLQTRKLEREQVCEKCEEVYNWSDSAMEIVPYATEYLRDYYTEEEIKAKQLAEGRKAAESVLNESEIDSIRPSDKPEYDESIYEDKHSYSDDTSDVLND